MYTLNIWHPNSKLLNFEQIDSVYYDHFTPLVGTVYSWTSPLDFLLLYLMVAAWMEDSERSGPGCSKRR